MDLKRFILSILLLATVLPAHAQRKVSADVEVKTVVNGKLSTVTKSVYCNSNGRMVTLFKKPLSYYMVSNVKGELQVYNPGTNEVYTQIDASMSSNAEPVQLFMTGRIDDLGLGYYGYKLGGTTREDGYIRKTYTPSDPSLPTVAIVSENYLPIYCEYTAADGKLLSKKYLSDYKSYGRFTMPTRITDISYGKDRDSSVVRTVYSSIKVDVDDPSFSFSVPADARKVKLEASSK